MVLTTGLLLTLLALLGRGAAEVPPLLTHETLFGQIATTGATFSSEARGLEGKPVRFRAFAVVEPRPEGGVYLTRTPETRLHPDDEDTLPWDAVGVVFRDGASPARLTLTLTVTGTLHLGNTRLGDETVVATITDAVPVPERAPRRRGTSGAPSGLIRSERSAKP